MTEEEKTKLFDRVNELNREILKLFTKEDINKGIPFMVLGFTFGTIVRSMCSNEDLFKIAIGTFEDMFNLIIEAPNKEVKTLVKYTDAGVEITPIKSGMH